MQPSLTAGVAALLFAIAANFARSCEPWPQKVRYLLYLIGHVWMGISLENWTDSWVAFVAVIACVVMLSSIGSALVIPGCQARAKQITVLGFILGFSALTKKYLA